jgi:release factor glutamine methyltransferase
VTDRIDVLLADATETLRRGGVADAAADARILLCAATGLGRLDLLTRSDAAVSGADAGRFRAWIARRAKREPVSRILARREFRSLDFEVSSDTLDPRPDSETLVELALDMLASGPDAPRILDLGTGTGCLLLSLLDEIPAATGVGTDISPGACAVARRNADRLGFAGRARFFEGNWAEPVDGTFDLVVSNPPYIAAAEKSSLEPEVAAFDPETALFGGDDGLDAYREIAAAGASLLAPGGTLVLEIGHRQEAAVSDLFRNAGYRQVARRDDLGGRPRSLAFGA